MLIYLIVLIVVSILAVFSIVIPSPKMNMFNSKKANGFLVAVIFLILFTLSAFRWRVGTDYWNYEFIFNNMKNLSLNEAMERSTEYGFIIINWVLVNLTNNTFVAFGFLSFITVGLIVLALRNYSTYFPFSVFLYITTMIYFSSFNGMRQWVAAAILFYGYQYIVKGNKKKYFAHIILASLFHTSSLIMIVIYFVVRNKFFSKMNLLVFVSFVSFAFFFDGFISLLLQLLEGTQYGTYEEWFKMSGKEANPLRFIVAVTPLFLCIIFYRILKKRRYDLDILINFSLLNSLFMLLAIHNNIFARFSIYFELYNLLLIPLLATLSNKQGNRIITLIIVSCYIVYMVLLLPVDSNLLPYRTIFGK